MINTVYRLPAVMMTKQPTFRAKPEEVDGEFMAERLKENPYTSPKKALERGRKAVKKLAKEPESVQTARELANDLGEIKRNL